LGVVAIAFGADTGILTRLSTANTTKIEQSLIDSVRGTKTAAVGRVAGSNLPIEGQFPSLNGATGWINSPPLTPAQLRGKVVLVDFWTYSCINCLRSLPYIKAWAAKYKDSGLVVIGVHAPEFAFEKDPDNVRRAVHDLGITYPVALDSNLAIWQAFDNEYWPAHYFIDAEGRIRAHHFGEGDYDASERIIQTLLKEAGHSDVPTTIVNPDATGTLAASDVSDVQSPETYVGYERGVNFASDHVTQDKPSDYTTPSTLTLNQWGLVGNWTIGQQMTVLNRAPGKIVFRFHARDLHLVLGPAGEKTPVRFRVTLDGKAPGAAHGADTDAAGNGTVTSQRLYQLIRQSGAIADHAFAIEFLDPGVQAYSFTFG